MQFDKRYDIITQYSKRPVSQAAKTSPSHGEGMGSIPVRVTKKEKAPQARCLFLFGDLCRKRHGVCAAHTWVRQTPIERVELARKRHSVCAAHTWVRQTPIERVELARKRQRRLFLPKGQMSVRVKYRKRGAFSFLPKGQMLVREDLAIQAEKLISLNFFAQKYCNLQAAVLQY